LSTPASYRNLLLPQSGYPSTLIRLSPFAFPDSMVRSASSIRLDKRD
jgi:hypothetical protein